jgi:hypothetical protein
MELIIYNSLFVIKAGIKFVFPCNTGFSYFNTLLFSLIFLIVYVGAA